MDKFMDILRTLFRPFLQWERLRHPYAGWLRLALGLSLPVVIWSHDPVLIALFLIALLSHPYWFPPYIEASDDEPLMTQFVDAWQAWFEKTTMEDRIVPLIPAVIIPLPLICALWEHELFWSLYFFAAAVGYKLLFLRHIMTEEGPSDE